MARCDASNNCFCIQIGNSLLPSTTVTQHCSARDENPFHDGYPTALTRQLPAYNYTKLGLSQHTASPSTRHTKTSHLNTPLVRHYPASHLITPVGHHYPASHLNTRLGDHYPASPIFLFPLTLVNLVTRATMGGGSRQSSAVSRERRIFLSKIPRVTTLREKKTSTHSY